MIMNERKTEDLVEFHLRKNGYYASDSDIVVEKQKSDTPRIQKLLEGASKRGGGIGRPEFLIHSKIQSNFLIVIECKADTRKHESTERNKYADYAVDGVLLYASFLSKEFDVLAIAISGQDEKTLRISHFLHLHKALKAVDYSSSDIVSINDYYDAFINSDAKFRQDYEALLDYSRALNNSLQAKKVTESDRGFLISGLLIALKNEAFKGSFKSHATAKQLATTLLNAIGSEFETAELPENRRKSLAQAFAFIDNLPALIEDKDFFIDLINGVDENINAFMRTHQFYDTIGQFYVEFLRYANNDKGLGIVLTPRHIAELFCEIAEVDKHSIVFDNCCGTGGLLIAAMQLMIQDAGPDKKVQENIKKHQILGIEFQPKIYALAVSNMILHGDGKTNILRGDCFSVDTQEAKLPTSTKPTVGLLNPPYKNKTVKEDKEELEFVFNNLDYLQQGAKCVAIVPMTCATAPSGAISEWKKRLLERHTLEAVMSMPIELFHNSKTTVVTCVMVFTAHKPHPEGKKTWFGYWRDDGFVKTKHRGRTDDEGTWTDTKSRWVNAFRNRDTESGLSIKREVGPEDEWCAEAYLESDYSLVTKDLLLAFAKNLALTNVMQKHSVRHGGDNND